MTPDHIPMYSTVVTVPGDPGSVDVKCNDSNSFALTGAVNTVVFYNRERRQQQQLAIVSYGVYISQFLVSCFPVLPLCVRIEKKEGGGEAGNSLNKTVLSVILTSHQWPSGISVSLR